MKTNRILAYQYEDKLLLPKLVAAVHLLFAAFLIANDVTRILVNHSFQICFVIAFVVGYLLKDYDWKASDKNGLILLLYAGSIIGEYFLGFPTTTIEANTTSMPTKGTIMTIMANAVPYVYISGRIILLGVLIEVVRFCGSYSVNR